MIVYLIGCIGWLIVGMRWRDRAVITINVAAVVILGAGILRSLLL